MDQAAVVTCLLRHDGEVLLFLRADDAETYPGRWGTVTGYVEHADPLASARMEIREETALSDFELIRRGDPFEVRDETLDREWEIHPFLFEPGSREVRTNEETARAEWTTPTAILRCETVPDLWASYDRVRPTPETIAVDDEHGSAYLSIRALEVLRDEAALAAEGGDGIRVDRSPDRYSPGTVEANSINSSVDPYIGEVHTIAEVLLNARPSMAALRNRVNRAVAGETTPAEAEQSAIEVIERALTADERTAERAAGRIEGHVFTLSRSGTVLAALREEAKTGVKAATATGVETVTVAESRPVSEGVDVAETLVKTGLDVRVCTDAAIAHILASDEIDCVLVGADTVLPDGRVVNKTGTRGAAIAADREDIPVYVAAASDKISTEPTPHLESGPADAVYDGEAGIGVINPTFDVTPAGPVDAVLTERGALSGEDIAGVASELRELGSWRED
ncbi:MAG: initiation factor 2B [Halobacteriales archaeon]